MPIFIDSADKKQYLIKQGKVRDVYATESTDHLVIVACDRISAFDHILPTSIPDKGVILTRMAKFWFNKTRHIVANHLVDTTPPLKPWFQGEMEKRISYVKKAEPLPVEAIVRGYLAGSGFKDYQRSGKVCGLELAAGLTESAKLPEPIFTPSTKAEVGKHDENISFEETVDLIGEELAVKVRDISLQLYAFAAKYALSRGIIIADTKFEFGLADGELLLIDELFTPDSSRFWPAEGYRPGKAQPSFDKQYVRDFLEGLAWDKKSPAPELPPEVVAKTSEKYWDALQRLIQ
ncbi:MAG: phosphoribosylaminoimidazolesuccinocarboxamide synthase [Desulfobulbaceae bacterium]|nr:MAG: phosphoribosylaminoimidazolesuccinocarboxamide synthase [Desulfobulbaceae bacterium]